MLFKYITGLIKFGHIPTTSIWFSKDLFYIIYVYETLDEMLVWLHCPLQLAGGTASMQQLKERLEKDLLEVPFPIWILTVPLPHLCTWSCSRIAFSFYLLRLSSLILHLVCAASRSLLRQRESKYWLVEMLQKGDSG